MNRDDLLGLLLPLHHGLAVFFLDDILAVFVNHGAVDLMNNFLVLLMNDWLLNLSDLLCVYDRLHVLMSHILMMLMDNILMVLDDDILMLFVDHVTMQLLHNGFLDYRVNTGCLLLPVNDRLLLYPLNDRLLVDPNDLRLRHCYLFGCPQVDSLIEIHDFVFVLGAELVLAARIA